ncbi:unnamed protein product, partial [Didymodactylos carnosus]
HDLKRIFETDMNKTFHVPVAQFAAVLVPQPVSKQQIQENLKLLKQ